MSETKTLRDLVYTSDRGERAYYQSKRSLKEQVRLPLTKDGCEALLEIVSKALDLPLDDMMRQDFAGCVHHTEMNVNSFTLSELGKVLWNRMSKTCTWQLDQEAKERRKADAEAVSIKEKLTLAIAKEDDDKQGPPEPA